MARTPSLTSQDVPDLTDAELAEMRPARKVMTAEEFAAVTSVPGTARSAEPKVAVTLRLGRRVLDAYKATGKGWQTRIDDLLAGSLGSVAATSREGAIADDGPIPADGGAGKRRA